MDAELAHLRLQLDAARKENSTLGQQLDDEMQKNSKVFQQLDDKAKENSQVLQQLSTEMEKNGQVVRQLDAERKKSAEAEQLKLSNAETISQLRGKLSRLQVQLNAAAHKAEAESAAAAQHAQHQQEQVSSLMSQLNSLSTATQAEQLQLAEAHDSAESGQAEAKRLQKQVSDARMRADLDAKQPIKLQADLQESKKHMAPAHHAELLAKVITCTLSQPGMTFGFSRGKVFSFL